MPNRTPKQQPAPHAAKDVERMRLEHDLITDSGIVPATKGRHAIYCLTVIGTIEGHSLAPDNQKSTKYEHVIPQLVDIEEDPAIEGLLVILNTVGGDVEAGLALAELISGVSKPSATLVLGGGHSIGIPLAVSARKSFIVPTATMTVHPVRHSGMVLGVPQTLRYFEQIRACTRSMWTSAPGVPATEKSSMKQKAPSAWWRAGNSRPKAARPASA